MLHKIHDPDRGAGIAEYAVVIVLVAAILAGLVVAGVPGRLRDGTRESVAVLLGEKPGKGSGDPADRDAGSGSDPDDIVSISAPGAPKKPADDDGVNEEWWDDSGTWGAPSDKMPLFGFQDRGGYNWDCGQVLDGFCKIGGGLYKGARDITDPIADIACLAHICSHSGFKNNWGSTADGVKKVFTQSPWTTAKEMWGGFKEPFDESAKNGGGFKNTAYAIPSAIGSVLSFKGVTKAFKKEEKAKEKDEKKKESPTETPQSQLEKARDAAREGDVKGAEKAARDADELAKESERRAKEDPSKENKEKAKSDRRAAEQAKLEAKAAKGFGLLLKTESGRKLHDLMKKAGGRIEFTSDSKLASTGMHTPGDNKITIGANYLHDPQLAAETLVHEMAHSRRHHRGVNRRARENGRDTFVSDSLMDEAESTLSEFELRDELRAQGKSIKRDEREIVYEQKYDEAIKLLRKIDMSEQRREQFARDSARDGLAKYIGGIENSVDRKKYRDYYGDYWDEANGKKKAD